LFLPYSLAHPASWLSFFAVFYGLDWVATVPPTVRLTANTFGKENVGVVYGWIGASHQLGASLAALTAGTIRTYLGDYRDAFWLSGGLCLLAATLLISTRARAQQRDKIMTTGAAAEPAWMSRKSLPLQTRLAYYRSAHFSHFSKRAGTLR
jgi:predicted MFS family arabinose efflux permease